MSTATLPHTIAVEAAAYIADILLEHQELDRRRGVEALVLLADYLLTAHVDLPPLRRQRIPRARAAQALLAAIISPQAARAAPRWLVPYLVRLLLRWLAQHN